MAKLAIRKFKERAGRNRRCLEAEVRIELRDLASRIGEIATGFCRSDRRVDPEDAAEQQHGADPRTPRAMTLADRRLLASVPAPSL